MNFITMLLIALMSMTSKYPVSGVANVYPDAGVVTEVELPDGNEPWDTVVTFEVANGNLFQFYGSEDLEVGDMIAVLMDDKGTLTVTDDEVLMVRYCSPVNVVITE